MTTINLHQNEETTQRSGKGGLFFALGILICTILSVFGLKMAVSTFQKQAKDLEAQIITEKSSLIGLGNINQFADIQSRLKEIKDNLKIENGQVLRVPMTKIIGHVGEDMNSSGVFLSTYKYEKDNKISLTLNALSFSDAAKQVFNFKNSKYFSNVSLDSITRGEKYIICTVTMNVK